MKKAILKFTLEFKEGITAGHGSQGNRMLVELNGMGEPVLRGSSLAGCLRSAYGKLLNNKQNGQLSSIFGNGAEAENGGKNNYESDSALKIPDVVLDTGLSIVNERICHMRSRHHGRPVDGGLFSIQFCPPGTKASVELHYEYDDESASYRPEAKVVFQKIGQILKEGLFLGGNSNRGVGLASLTDELKVHIFDDNVNGYAEYFDYCYDNKMAISWENLSIPNSELNNNKLILKLSWKIAEGEDLLVSSGGSADSALDPMLMKHANGKEYYAIPGSSFRGVFRNWFNHLAAKEGKKVSDSVENFLKHHGDALNTTFSGDEISRLFTDKKVKIKPDEHKKYVVDDLFGSLHKAGRIHISSAFQEKKNKNAEQDRAHVAIDYITGGAIEHMLFNTVVLVNNQDPFENEIIIQDPTEDEIKWLAKSLNAFNLGLLRLGSSKASGLMNVKILAVVGKSAEVFKQVFKG